MNTARMQPISLHPADLSIRPARAADHGAVLALLQSLDLGYPAMDLSCFQVLELNGVLAAVAELKGGEDWFLLSCVGVREDLQGKGIGMSLVDQVCRNARSPVYLYTMVPAFFRKAGFVDATSLPAALPPRALYGCSDCTPLLCRCLVRHPNAS